MKVLIATVALLLTVPPLVWAGNADGNSVHGQFYFFTAPIVSNTQYYANPAYIGVVFLQSVRFSVESREKEKEGISEELCPVRG